MPIPVAKEIQHNILTQAARAKAQGPIATDDSTAKSGMAFKSALNNAEEGFAKLYLANQRADAIDAYQEYEKELETLRDGAEIDPVTGLPQGFLNLKGDQINQENLDAWTGKVGEAKAKLDSKLKGYIPDIRDEYSRKADAEMFGNTNAINAHYLKGTWEHSKNSALAENENIIQNKPALNADDAKVYYETFRANHFNYTYDEKQSEILAEKDMERLVDANTRRILTDNPDGRTYADAKAYVRSLSGTPGYGKTTADAKLHKLDLDSGKFELTKPTTTAESMKSFLNRNTTHLDELEKATLIATALKHDGNAQKTGNDAQTNKWVDIVTRLSTGQEDFFSDVNDYGVYFENQDGTFARVSKDEAEKFRTDFLEFMTSLSPRLAIVNDEELLEQGLEGVLDKEVIKMAKSKSRLMDRTLNVLDSSLKKGSLLSVDPKGVRSLLSIANGLKKENPDIFRARERYNNIASDLEDLVKKPELSREELYTAIDKLKEMESLYGSAPIGYDDPRFSQYKASIAKMAVTAMPKAFNDPGEIWMGSRWAQRWNAIGDVRRFEKLNPDKDSSFVQKNNVKIMNWLQLSQSTVKDEYGRQSIVNSIYKTFVDIGQQMMDDNLTLVPLSANGEPDPSRGVIKRKMFAIDGKRRDDKKANSDAAAYRIATEFGEYLNKKYNTKDYSNFMDINYAKLNPEDREYLRELSKQRFLEENDLAGYTCLDSNIDYNSIIMADVAPLSDKWPVSPYGSFLGIGSNEPSAEERIKDTPFIGPVGKEVLDTAPFIGPVNRSVMDMEFTGGVATAEQEAVLVQQGYPSYEDYLYKKNVILPGMQPNGLKVVNVYRMLATIAPYGERTTFVNSQKNEELALGRILSILKDENPNVSADSFFESGFPGYNVSDKSYQKIADIYEKTRKYIIAQKRELYYSSLGKKKAKESAEKAFGEGE